MVWFYGLNHILNDYFSKKAHLFSMSVEFSDNKLKNKRCQCQNKYHIVLYNIAQREIFFIVIDQLG